VIPARGGSKRIPRKNVREFCGRPMIAHSILCATESGLFDKVIVSTDDAEIAAVARDFGGQVPFLRPAALADDHTGTSAVVAHAIAYLQSQGESPSAVCCIYATAPFLQRNDLAEGLRLLEQGDWQYVFAAARYGFPIFRSFHEDKDGGLAMFFPEHFDTRSQDLPEALYDAGQFYWGRPKAWLEGTRIFDRTSTVVTLPRWRVQDIDTAEDWERAEIIWRMLQANAQAR
jgi:N-acylneuraminate cytidylyltransferase